MANLANVLKEEVGTLARRELRRQTADVDKSMVRCERDIAALKREVEALMRELGAALRSVFDSHQALLQRITAPSSSLRPPCRDKLSPVLLHSYIGIFNNSLDFDHLDLVLYVSSRSPPRRVVFCRHDR